MTYQWLGLIHWLMNSHSHRNTNWIVSRTNLGSVTMLFIFCELTTPFVNNSLLYVQSGDFSGEKAYCLHTTAFRIACYGSFISDVIRYLIGIILDFHIAHTMFREVRSLTSGYNFSYPKSKHEKLHNQVWQACSDTFPLISYRT